MFTWKNKKTSILSYLKKKKKSAQKLSCGYPLAECVCKVLLVSTDKQPQTWNGQVNSTVVHSFYNCILFLQLYTLAKTFKNQRVKFILQLYTLAKTFYCCTLLQKHPKKEQTSYHSCTILQKHSTIVHSCKKFFFCTLLQKHKKKKNGTVKNIPISTRKKT